MTKVKIDSKVGGGPAEALEPYVRSLYDTPGKRIVGVIELTHVERVQPAPGSDGEPSVKMRISAMELATKEQEPAIRDAQRALFLQRTAQGTLDEHGQLELSKDTLRLCSGILSDIQLARLSAGASNYARLARRIANSNKDLTASELRHELRTVADGLNALLNRVDDPNDPDEAGDS